MRKGLDYITWFGGDIITEKNILGVLKKMLTTTVLLTIILSLKFTNMTENYKYLFWQVVWHLLYKEHLKGFSVANVHNHSLQWTLLINFTLRFFFNLLRLETNFFSQSITIQTFTLSGALNLKMYFKKTHLC